jgi:hypothetical protein
MILGETKLFTDNTLANKLTPPWLAQRLAAYNYERDVFTLKIGADAVLGAFTLSIETYTGGVHESQSGLVIEPGQSCAVLHMDELFVNDTNKTPHTVTDTIERVRFSLGALRYYIDSCTPPPAWIVGVTHRRLAQAAQYFGFDIVPEPSSISECTQVFYKSNIPLLQKVTPPKHHHDLASLWLVYTSTERFCAQQPYPLGPLAMPRRVRHVAKMS